MLNRIVVLLCFVLLIASCRTKQKVVLPQPNESENKDIIKSFEINNLNYITFSGKAKSNVSVDGDSQSFTTNIRVDKGKKIWMSLTGALGIEAARVLITPDSIQIMNKIHGEYIAKPFEYIYNYTSRSLSFVTLQDIIIGNVSSDLLKTSDVQVASSDTDMQLIGTTESLIFHYILDSNRKPNFLKLDQVDGAASLEATYAGFKNYEGYTFATKFMLAFTGKEFPINATWEYNKVSFNEVLEFPFNVPSRYKVIN